MCSVKVVFVYWSPNIFWGVFHTQKNVLLSCTKKMRMSNNVFKNSSSVDFLNNKLIFLISWMTFAHEVSLYFVVPLGGDYILRRRLMLTLKPKFGLM